MSLTPGLVAKLDADLRCRYPTNVSTIPPDRGPAILFFTGGTALRGLSRELKKLTHRSIHLMSPFDSGGSSATLREAFGMLAVGDIRNRMTGSSRRRESGGSVVRAPTGRPLCRSGCPGSSSRSTRNARLGPSRVGFESPPRSSRHYSRRPSSICDGSSRRLRPSRSERWQPHARRRLSAQLSRHQSGPGQSDVGGAHSRDHSTVCRHYGPHRRDSQQRKDHRRTAPHHEQGGASSTLRFKRS